MKNKFKFLIVLTLVFSLSVACEISPKADMEYNNGCAIYRDGAFLGTTWHAGFCLPSGNNYIHIGGINQGITTCSKSTFLDGNNFAGYYHPFTTTTSGQNTSIILTATLMELYDIGYNAVYQVYYDLDEASTRVQPDEITSIRCDGVVEYCYEYNGIYIFGSNISINSSSIRSEHSGTAITPKKQAKYYMKNMLGDVNLDGSVSASDSRVALRYASGLESLSTHQVFIGDVTGSDRTITAADAQLILRASAGLEGDGVVANIGKQGGYRFPNDACISS